MKNVTLLRFILIILPVSLGFTNVFAQNISEGQVIKDWLIANGNSITLVSQAEYQALPASEKEVLDANISTVFYESEVTVEDIQGFESKNTGKKIVTFQSIVEKTEKTNSSKTVVELPKTGKKATKLDEYISNNTIYTELYLSKEDD